MKAATIILPPLCGAIAAGLVAWGMFAWWAFWMVQLRHEGATMLALRWGFSLGSGAVCVGFCPVAFLTGIGVARLAMEAREDRES